MRDTLLTLHGDAHRRRRALELRVFHRNFLRYYEQTVFPATLAETLAPAIAAGGADLIELGYRLTVNLTADFAGIDRPARTVAETETLIALVKTFSEGATLVHSRRDHADVIAECEVALASFRDHFVLASVERRQALLAAGDAETLPRDILTVILANEDRLELADDVVLREMAFYMQAGAHSTANATVHAIHEIFEWAGVDATRWQRLDEPLFIQRCVHESLRLHPASPEAVRRATAALDLAAEGRVVANDIVVMDLFAANRDTTIFGDDAHSFDPDRRLPQGVPPSGLTFGMGRHSCLGRDLDGGILPRVGADAPGADAPQHQFGIVALVVGRLLGLGARRDPADMPTTDNRTSRQNWGRYHVLFEKAVRA